MLIYLDDGGGLVGEDLEAEGDPLGVVLRDGLLRETGPAEVEHGGQDEHTLAHELVPLLDLVGPNDLNVPHSELKNFGKTSDGPK